MVSLNQPVQTMIARDFSLNVEVSLKHVMYPHQLMQTKVARDFPHNMEAIWVRSSSILGEVVFHFG